jgi:hypothetical protein
LKQTPAAVRSIREIIGEALDDFEAEIEARVAAAAQKACPIAQRSLDFRRAAGHVCVASVSFVRRCALKGSAERM